jgi:hypothetical protein
MSSEAHNAAILPCLKLLVEAAQSEADQWILLETLCCGIGKLHQRTARQTAEFIDLMSERIATGEREWPLS